MKISALQSYFTYMVILIEYWAKWLIRSLQGTVCLILFWNVCLHKRHTRKSLEATIICNVEIFRFLWSFPSPEGSNSSSLVDKSSQKHPPPSLWCLAEIWPFSCPGMQTSDESDFPQENAAALFLRHIVAWLIQVFLQQACFNSLHLHEENTRGKVRVWAAEGYQVPSSQCLQKTERALSWPCLTAETVTRVSVPCSNPSLFSSVH